MIKKLDSYTLKTFFGPFIFVFSVLFFIFMVQFAWQEMEKFAGKGLDFITILKLLFYLGLSVIQLVMPLTVLLAAIMTFGGFGERYELAAMKSTGVSLYRIMAPIFIIVCMLSVGLFYFSDTVIPDAQKKAKNMLLNIARTKPALNFDAGIFIDGVPGFTMKIGEKSGKNAEFIKDVFIHKNASPFQNQQTILADNGIFEPAEDKRFLKLSLYNGIIYEEEIKGKNRASLQRQAHRQIKFDSMSQYFDISALINQAIEDEKVTDHYKFMSTKELYARIDTLKGENKRRFVEFGDEFYTDIFPENRYINDKADSTIDSTALPFRIDDLSVLEKDKIYTKAISDVKTFKDNYEYPANEIRGRSKFFARHVLQVNRNFSNSLMCIIFFLIGAPLGAIIRKGGVGMPVVVAIIIFILFYLIYMYGESLAKSNSIDATFASWLPTIVFLPLGLFFTYKAMTDSTLFNIDGYLQPIKRLFTKFGGNKKKEHARYQ